MKDKEILVGRKGTTGNKGTREGIGGGEYYQNILHAHIKL